MPRPPLVVRVTLTVRLPQAGYEIDARVTWGEPWHRYSRTLLQVMLEDALAKALQAEAPDDG